MGTNIRQNTDGSMSWVNDDDGLEMARMGGPAASRMAALGQAYRGRHVIKQRIAITQTQAFGISNPFGTDVIVGLVYLNVSTTASVTATIDIGVTNAITASIDNLLDGQSLGGTALALSVYDNITDKGTNGKSRQLWTTSQFITGVCSATATACVADLYVECFVK